MHPRLCNESGAATDNWYTVMNCQACNSSLRVRLNRNATGDQAIGCCADCHSFTCGEHGMRDRLDQQFRCVECFPNLILLNAVVQSGAENECAKAILGRQPAAWRMRYGTTESFLQHHDIFEDHSRQTLSGFFKSASFDLCRPEVQKLNREKTARDLSRIQFRLQSTSHQDALKLAGAYLAFIYPLEREHCACALPADMQVLRSAVAPLAM
jgi:hypothetical protein